MNGVNITILEARILRAINFIESNEKQVPKLEFKDYVSYDLQEVEKKIKDSKEIPDK
jgi:hypothetical protein